MIVFALHFVNVVDVCRLKITGICKFVIFSTPLILTIYVSKWLAILIILGVEIILFVLFFKSKFLLPLIEYLVAYYYLAFIMSLISPYVHFINFSIAIQSVEGLWSLLTAPASFIMLKLVTSVVDKLFHLGNYKKKIIINYEGCKALTKGYFDTGNTLKYKGLPVIFIKRNCFPFSLQATHDEIEYQTMNGISITKLYRASVLLDDKRESDVYFALVNENADFNGCECLLNAYLGV